MLDQSVKSQLEAAFALLDKSVVLVYKNSKHADQEALLELLGSVVCVNKNLSTRASDDQALSPYPAFGIEIDGVPSRINFEGIPTGHEFTSLILAMLNAAGLGRMPDESLKQRIRNIKGPVHLRTYISLTCENCPEVVQALNQMAIISPSFSHTMVDGAYVSQEISALGIQGVPSVVSNKKLLQSGKSTILELLEKLEAHFGSNADSEKIVSQALGHFDMVVIGGGPAGVSSAIYSVRKGLKTAVLAEKIGGQVQDTKGIENMISLVYTEGPKLSGQMYEHLKSYPIQILEHRRVQEITKGRPHQLVLTSGETLTADQIIVATGAKWRELGIPGEKEYLGRGVAYCPHCDGPFYKDKDIAVVGGGNSGIEAAIDLSGIVKSVVLIEFGEKLKADKVLVDKLLTLKNVTVVTNTLSKEVVGNGSKVTGIKIQNRSSQELQELKLDGIFVQIGLLPNSGFLKNVVELTPHGEVVVDLKGHTSAEQIYAAGDVTTTPYKQIVIAMGEGAKVALSAFEDRMRRTAT